MLVSEGAPSVSARSAIVDACSQGVRPGRCVAAESAGATSDVTVTFPTTSVARVSTRTGASRDLSFRPEDRDEDRYRAIGLVAAALAHPEEAETVAPAAPPAPARPEAPLFAIQAGALGGSGLSTGPPRYGGWIRGLYRFDGSALTAFLGAEYALAGARASAHPSWLPVSAGIGGTFATGRGGVFFLPSIGFVAERLSVTARDAASGETASRSRFLPGVTGGVLAGYPHRAPFAVVLELTETYRSGGTAVRVRGERVGSFPSDDFTIRLGIHIALWP